MSHSVANKNEIPAPSILSRRLQSLAMLDAILMPDWSMRFFSYNSKWAPGEAMGSMRNGEGDEFFFWFASGAAIGKITVTNAPVVANLQKLVPTEFESFVREPAFQIESATHCLWFRRDDDIWNVVPLGIEEIPLLRFVANDGSYYQKWAEAYYETDISVNLVNAIFNQDALTDEVVLALNAGAELSRVCADASEIGYPV